MDDIAPFFLTILLAAAFGGWVGFMVSEGNVKSTCDAGVPIHVLGTWYSCERKKS